VLCNTQEVAGQSANLGRWKSNIILEYAQEALESLAVNASQSFVMTEKLSELLRSQNTIPLSAPDTTKGDKADKEIVDRLKMELQKFKQDTKGSNDSLSSAVKELEEKMKTANKYLPPLVKSTRHQLLHKNNKVLIYAPACMWKTICGWHYYSANYTFEEGEDSKVSCAKCQLSAQQQGGQVC